MSNYRDDKDKLKQAKHDAAQLTIFHNWITEHPEFDFLAARQIIQNYYNGEDWSFDNLTESVQRLVEKGVIKPRKDYQIEEDAESAEIKLREQLVQFIMDNRKMSDDTRRGEFARLSSKHTTTETLQTIVDNIKRARLSEQELKKQADEEFKAQQAAHGIRSTRWLPVPLIYQTRSMLLSLASENTAEFRRLVQRSGDDAINKILAQRDEE